MFKITADNLKTTYATVGALAGTLEDYLARGVQNIKVAQCERKEYHLDFGGMMLTTMKPAQVGFLGFFPHQTHHVREALHKAHDRGDYIKVHGAWTCLSMTLEERNELTGLLAQQSGRLEAMADEQFAQWSAR